ncbi:MAG: hypothetical protein LQ338_005012 [Usnochroma carphineum]|nr:MAG: hypothetical protein LQ338_005012 [Usnochroma carphineum]
MVKFPLTGLTIAATGDFGPCRSHDTLKRWVERNGGQWVTKMSEQVTHLICTKEDYRSKAPMGDWNPPKRVLTVIYILTSLSVKQALRLKLFTIVTYDWLEDSLMRRFRLAPRGDYLVARAIKDAKKVKKAKKQTKKETIKKGGTDFHDPKLSPQSMPTCCTVDSFKKECQDIQKQLFSDRYHVYRDSTFFAYDITLVRVNLLQNKSERYVLRLCTTHDVPHYFATLLTYHARNSDSDSNATPAKAVLAPIGSDWTTAFEAFTKAFKGKTGVEWEERFVPRRWGDGGGFVYQVPREGEARGE